MAIHGSSSLRPVTSSELIVIVLAALLEDVCKLMAANIEFTVMTFT